ncbi:MAG: hypothetical protein IPL33_19605 [Sphingobacteriales bacterium]|nr:hypothetical protein [Sphingobacteriales bacterium]
MNSSVQTTAPFNGKLSPRHTLWAMAALSLSLRLKVPLPPILPTSTPHP